MAVFIALLRAVNVGGTGKLPMNELASICSKLGFEQVRTYIQSGNVVFESALSEDNTRARLEQALTNKMGKRIDIAVRTAAELRSILEENPFPDAPPARVGVAFLSKPVPKTLLKDLAGLGTEQVRLGSREIYIYYPDGMGRSKLKLPPSADPATVRNINTVAKLVAMAEAR
jgi:uncharacterized protein (DUF1697 family)